MVDLNSDLGENEPGRVVSDDDAMLRVVTSANVSCGVHAGTADGIRATLAAAVARGVAIGAHPSYRDREGFGRRMLDVDSPTLQADVEEQIGLLRDLAAAAGARLAYVKPHGALYNAIVHDERQARDVVAAVRAVDPSLALLALPGGVVQGVAAHAGLRIVTEAFADRAYLPSGGLVPRAETGAVLHDPDVVSRRMARLAQEGVVDAIDGSDVAVRADSICVHGDSPGAVAMAAAVRRRLEAEGIPLTAFA
ncbi:LamB/YcsF family protein [Microbacterium betulae]|uniref:LamB/YcsF family protein n=1 Tax=Microbacterium betulae TaxID=2981139 RepID=A0AA97FGP0_9MICO|nr:5-oxoprolinase subunit PxpA [Microbacterium sp. AB]WOF21759.1 LamB/YcsF family protein [Microbacterium sp. AB]